MLLLYNVGRASTRVQAPPGGQSSITFGGGVPDAPPTSRSNARPTSSADFYGQSGAGDASSRPTPRARQSHPQQTNSNIFGTEPPSPSSSRRGSQQPKPTLDVFESDSGSNHGVQTTATIGRRPLSSPEKVDIYGRNAVPVQNPSRRNIQQPTSDIFERNGRTDESQDNRSVSSQSRENATKIQSNAAPAGVIAGTGSRRQSVNQSSEIFDSVNTHEGGGSSHAHRRPAPSTQSGEDVFGNRKGEYREPTDYQSSSLRQQANSSHARRGGDTTQSLGNMLTGENKTGVQKQHQPPRHHQSSISSGNSSASVGSVMGGQASAPEATSSRRQSRAGQSSLVLN